MWFRELVIWNIHAVLGVLVIAFFLLWKVVLSLSKASKHRVQYFKIYLVFSFRSAKTRSDLTKEVKATSNTGTCQVMNQLYALSGCLWPQGVFLFYWKNCFEPGRIMVSFMSALQDTVLWPHWPSSACASSFVCVHLCNSLDALI